MELGIKGPLIGFTVIADLERGEVRVQGQSPAGWLRYRICAAASGRGAQLLVEKAPQGELNIQGQSIAVGTCLELVASSEPFAPYHPPLLERLALGSHKAQDIELIQRAVICGEIWPIWHRLGQMIPFLDPIELHEGDINSFSRMRKCPKDTGSEFFIDLWKNSFKAGFF